MRPVYTSANTQFMNVCVIMINKVLRQKYQNWWVVDSSRSVREEPRCICSVGRNIMQGAESGVNE
jgi:hypothetical protein